jgi:hypothetical protein
MDEPSEECETRVAFVLTLILLGKLVGQVKLSGIVKSGALAQRVGQAAPGARAR